MKGKEMRVKKKPTVKKLNRRSVQGKQQDQGE
jgi:hypothetical protein